MAIIRTHNAVFDSIYVNNTSTAGKRYGMRNLLTHRLI
jgi:hypothetical protein